MAFYLHVPRLAFTESLTMEKACPAKCAFGIQRPLELVELAQLSNRARAEVALLQQTVVICESCGCVYVDSLSGTVYLGNVPAMRR